MQYLEGNHVEIAQIAKSYTPQTPNGLLVLLSSVVVIDTICRK